MLLPGYPIGLPWFIAWATAERRGRMHGNQDARRGNDVCHLDRDRADLGPADGAATNLPPRPTGLPPDAGGARHLAFGRRGGAWQGERRGDGVGSRPGPRAAGNAAGGGLSSDAVPPWPSGAVTTCPARGPGGLICVLNRDIHRSWPCSRARLCRWAWAWARLGARDPRLGGRAAGTPRGPHEDVSRPGWWLVCGRSRTRLVQAMGRGLPAVVGRPVLRRTPACSGRRGERSHDAAPWAAGCFGVAPAARPGGCAGAAEPGAPLGSGAGRNVWVPFSSFPGGNVAARAGLARTPSAVP